MRHFLQLNDFKIDVPGLERNDTYHPVYGTSDDPFLDTRWSLLKRRVGFAWRKLLAPRTAAEPAPAIEAAVLPAPPGGEAVLQSGSGDTLVVISRPGAR